MPRLRQVPRAEAPPEVQQMYDMLFGDRDPVAEPGTATGTPGNWLTVVALVPPTVLGACDPPGSCHNRRFSDLDLPLPWPSRPCHLPREPESSSEDPYTDSGDFVCRLCAH